MYPKSSASSDERRRKVKGVGGCVCVCVCVCERERERERVIYISSLQLNSRTVTIVKFHHGTLTSTGRLSTNTVWNQLNVMSEKSMLERERKRERERERERAQW